MNTVHVQTNKDPPGAVTGGEVCCLQLPFCGSWTVLAWTLRLLRPV